MLRLLPRRVHGGRFSVLLCLVIVLLSGFPASAQTPPRRVLVLYTYSRHLPWETGIVAGLQEILSTQALSGRLFLYEENLDSDLANIALSVETQVAYLLDKYRAIALDAVITESQSAASILLAFPELFPGIPRYLFNYAPSTKLGVGTGSERRYSCVSDLETALHTIALLRPGVRRIVVIADRSVIGLARSEQVRSLASGFKDTPLEVWDDYTVPELLDRVRSLPENAAILYLPVQRDREGTPLVAAVVASDLARAAPVPVFSHFDSLVGTGIVGGYSISAVQIGRMIGRVAVSGDLAAPDSQADYAAKAMGYWFDSRALERWNIPRNLLPQGSNVLFSERSFLEQYWVAALAALLLFAVESLLVSGLYRSSSQRKKALASLAAERASLDEKILSRTSELADANARLVLEVAERSVAEAREKAIAEEKITLLKELQHRVKNNMAIIASLVGIEAGKAESKEAKSVLAALETRISALTSLYDVLYETGGIGFIDLVDYISRVVETAGESLGADARGVTLILEIKPVAMDVKRAVSIGLIVNELVTDGLKYAFPEAGSGTVTISLTEDSGLFTLGVKDDGIGLPADFDPANSHGFGMKLVTLLSDQLSGTFRIGRGTSGGAEFSIEFPA
jgi:two-component sensor histidine kinase